LAPYTISDRSRVNHDTLNRDQFHEAIKHARNTDIFIMRSADTIKSWDAPGGSGAGCVGLLLHLTSKNKKDGKEIDSSTLFVTNVQIHDGKRVLTVLTEVSS
jgi:hypothetical protein